MATKQEILKKITEERTSINDIDGLEKFNDDEDIAEALIFRSSRNLKFLSPRLQDNKELVFKAVSKYGRSIEYASNRLKNDKEVIKIAILDMPASLEKLSIDISDVFYMFDKNEIISYIHLQLGLFRYIRFMPESIKSDKEFISNTLKQKPEYFKYLPEELKNDKNVMSNFLKHNSRYFKDFPKQLKDDYDIVMLAIKDNINNLEFSSERIQKEINIEVNVTASKTVVLEAECTIKMSAYEYFYNFDEESCIEKNASEWIEDQDETDYSSEINLIK